MPAFTANHVLGETWTFPASSLGQSQECRFLAAAHSSATLVVRGVDEEARTTRGTGWSGTKSASIRSFGC